MSTNITVYQAQKILTMNPERPETNCVAVMDGRILGTGDFDELTNSIKNSVFKKFTVNKIFEDKVIMPGIVMPHTHIIYPALEYANHFVAQVEWPTPQGGYYPVCRDKKAVLERLKQLDDTMPPGKLLWGTHYDENVAGGDFTREELDSVSRDRPIFISNQVAHRFWGNTKLLECIHVGTHGKLHEVVYTEAGEPTGTILEWSGLRRVLQVFPEIKTPTIDMLHHILPLYRSQGITTVSEIFGGGQATLEQEIALCRQITEHESHGIRCAMVPCMHFVEEEEGSFDAALQKMSSLMHTSSERYIVTGAKLYYDGSIISHTAKLDWPGYFDGTSNDLPWNYPSEVIRKYIIELHKLNIPTATHTNTNLAIQTVLDAVEEAQAICFRPNIRHRVDHCYTITSDQIYRAKALGVALQFFTPQIYYYGDSHLKILGADRAYHICPVATAERLGVSWGFHSDPPGTPELPWLGAWSTVQRTTLKGKVLGEGQRVPVASALHAMTLEAARQLHMDHLIGSIEAGKRADFCVLEADPLNIDADALKEMPVWGTVMDGELFQKG